MKRQSIIVLLNYTEEPITRGNLKKLCEEFNFPYHTLYKSTGDMRITEEAYN